MLLVILSALMQRWENYVLVNVTGALAGCCNKANAQEKSARPRVIGVITQRSEYLQRPRWFWVELD